jgi:hypothetical protein
MFNILNGWKTVLGYIGLNFIDAGLIDAVVDVVIAPTPENIGKVITHGLITVGLVHKVIKERL